MSSSTPVENGVYVTPETVNQLVVDDPKKPWKAIGSFLAPLVLLFINFFTDPSDGGTSITSSEWTTLATTCVLTAIVAFGLSNPKTLKA